MKVMSARYPIIAGLLLVVLVGILAVCWKPDPARAYDELSDRYWESGQYEESIELWKQAKQKHPEWNWPYVRLACDYNDLGMYDEAIAEWKELIEREPNMAGLYVMLGDTYRAADRPQDAQDAYEQALTIDPDHRQAKQRSASMFSNATN